MQLYVIRCGFKIVQNQDMIEGLAICSDPATPVTFIYPDGKPYTGNEIWTYNLRHYSPWAKFTN